jgi:hypothetical protein
LAQHFVAQGSAADALASLPFSLGGLGLLVWAWVEVGFLRGTPEANRFGPPPPIGVDRRGSAVDRAYCAAIASAWRRSTETSCEMPRSGMVTP